MVAVVLASGLLAACKGDAKTTTFVTSPDAGQVPGYKGGTPITLADGTPVTLVDGTPVTSPRLNNEKDSGKKSGGSTTTGLGDSDVATPVTSPGGTSSTATTFIFTTGTTSVAPTATPDHLALPKQGAYGFHEKVSDDDGSPPKDRDLFYTYSSDGARGFKVQETGGDQQVLDYYIESHDDDGLFLVNSALVGAPCEWSPKAAQLPLSIIAAGSKVTTNSTCSTKVQGEDQSFKLSVSISFMRFKTVNVGGKEYRCIDVARHRVLSRDDVTITSDAIDTYAFDLGLRIATSDHSTTRQGDSIKASVRDLTITSLPK